MPAKKTGCLGKFLAVLFTSIVAPVLTNVFTREVDDWRRAKNSLTESKPAAAVNDWSRPVVDSGNERKGRDPSPQGVAAEPFSRRLPAPMGRPFR